MRNQPTAVKIERNAVKIYDAYGTYLNQVGFGSNEVRGATIHGSMLAVNLRNGRLVAYAVAPGKSPAYQYTR